MESGHSMHEKVAIIGLACRLPGGNDTPAKFWEFVDSGKVAIRDTPPDRFDMEDSFSNDPDEPGTTYSRCAGYVDRPYSFDAEFFRVSAAEALEMDPQQRWTLELCWSALENAGIVPSELRGRRVGLFMTAGDVDYARRTVFTGDNRRISTYAKLGANRAIGVGRVAHILGFHGPAVFLDSTCSSSLVAVHLAALSLRAGDCDLAIAGGVNLILGPEETIGLARLRAMSLSDACRPFDSKADGFIRGEGAGAVVLKRARDAIGAGDRIEAVLAGSSINNDGASNGLTAPNGAAQEAVIRQALAQAQAKAEDVVYVEAHGTGTPLGDPIELSALRNVYTRAVCRKGPLLVGSVKAQIGHLEVAAGIAGLIKAVLVLRYRRVPAQAAFEEPNPKFRWEDAQIEIPRAAQALPDGDHLVGVSSFGMSGTNAHVLLAAAPKAIVKAQPARARVLTISARSGAARRAIAAQYREQIARGGSSLRDLCYTASVRREHWNHRIAIAGTTSEDFVAALDDFLQGRETGLWHAGELKRRRRLVFLFPGQGVWRPGIGESLYRANAFYRTAVDHCLSLLSADVATDVKRALSGDPERVRHHPGQLAHFTVLHSLALSWIHLGLVPDAVLGHSLGEHVAAVVAGVMSLQDGLKVVEARGRLFDMLTPAGAMLAVAAGPDELASVLSLGTELFAAGFNAPDQTVVSGSTEAILAAEKLLKASGLRVARLQSYDRPCHTPLLAPMREHFRQTLASVKMKEPKIQLFSTLTGGAASADVATTEHWLDLVEQPVRFRDALSAAIDDDVTFLEVGPRATLSNLARGATRDWEHSISTLGDGPDGDREPEPDGFAHACARLYCAGHAPEWRRLYGADPQPVEAPTYAFETTHIELAASHAGALPMQPADSFPGRRMADVPGDDMVRFEGSISVEDPAWLPDYVVDRRAACPSAALLVAIADFASERRGDAITLIDVKVATPVICDEPQRIHFTLDRSAQSVRRVSVHSRPRDNDVSGWTHRASARIAAEANVLPAVAYAQDEAEWINAECFYDSLERRGQSLRGEFRRIRSVCLGWEGGRAIIDSQADRPRRISASDLDAVFQAVGLNFMDDFQGFAVPIAVDRISIPDVLPPHTKLEVVSHIQLSQVSQVRSVDVDVLADGRILFQARGISVKDSVALRTPMRDTPVRAVQRTEPALVERASYAEILKAIAEIALPIVGDLVGRDESAALTSLGVDSLALMELRMRLQQRFGRSVPMAMFASGLSLRGLVEFYESDPRGVERFSVEHTVRARDAQDALMHASAGNGDSGSQKTTRIGTSNGTSSGAADLVVTLRQGKGPVVALVHPVGGDVLCYSELAAAWPGDAKVVGLRHPNGDGEDVLAYRSLDQLASIYRRALMRAVDHFPQLLGGWSFGGAVAQEMARQWEEEGIYIPGLVLIDSPLPDGAYVARANEFMLELGDVDDAELVQRLLTQPRFRAMIDEEFGLSRLRKFVDEATSGRISWIHAANFVALARHTPKAVRAPLSYALARRAQPARTGKEALGHLGVLSKGELRVSDFEDDHFSIMRSEAAKQVARFLGGDSNPALRTGDGELVA